MEVCTLPYSCAGECGGVHIQSGQVLERTPLSDASPSWRPTMLNPVDDLRMLVELHECHDACTAELARAERTVERLTGRIAELEETIKEREAAQ